MTLTFLSKFGADELVRLKPSVILAAATSQAVADLAAVKHLPMVYGYREHVVDGGLISYGVDLRFAAKSLDEEKEAARRLNKAALDNVVFVPLGGFYQYQAWRRSVSGIVKGPLPFFWGVSKTA